MRRILVLALLSCVGASGAEPPRRPNIVFIMADDLGMGEVGCYGQTKIRTPAIDRIAAEGIRFTDFYSGAPVCAPARCVLMTGMHLGHAIVRNNREIKPEGQHPLPTGTVTIASRLKALGYSTGAMGKWGLGGPESSGAPDKQGFDLFFGYNCQRHAHNHYTPWLRRNTEKVIVDANPVGDLGKVFSHDLMETEALKFLGDNKDRPFFLFLPFIIPHMAMQVPEDSLAEYKGKWEDPAYDGKKGYRAHPAPRAAYAAMVTRMDRTVGRVLERLKELGLDDNTWVFFTSDNGPAGGYGGTDPAFFNSSAGLRGFKGSVYEGGLRVPMVARAPGRIKPGSVSNLPLYFADVLPTLCAIAGVDAPAGIDGISFLPTLRGTGDQKVHDFLYWEFSPGGGQQAVRMGNWKGVRQNLLKGKTLIELYDLSNDPGEKDDVAAKHPDVVARIARLMKEQHTPSADFPFKTLD